MRDIVLTYPQECVLLQCAYNALTDPNVLAEAKVHLSAFIDLLEGKE